jgi:murein DD-endopeptidase MepM/ murein hydrolase activator NlpD
MDQNGMSASRPTGDGLLARALPEQMLILRSRGATRCLRLSTRMQAAALAAVCATGLWTAAATGMLALHSYGHIQDAGSMDAATAAFRARVAALETEREALRSRLEAAESRVAAAGASEPASGLIAASEVALAAAAAERDALRARADAAAAALGETEAALARAEAERRDLGDTLARIAAALDAAASDRDAALVSASEAEGAREAIAADAAEMQDMQTRLLDHIEAAAARSLGPLERMLRDSGVDIDRMLRQLRRDEGAQGGPFLPAGDAASLPQADVARIASVVSDLERVALLQEAADRMPIALPVRGARITSGFGKRRDPFVRRLARHEGIDFSARIGTAIMAPAEGVVTFVGVQRGYGRMVKIEHAFGFETVYAHLSVARVRVGQRVTRGLRIGDVGNTGRSTGPHLHYEIHVDGAPVDPMKFIEAGRHVL